MKFQAFHVNPGEKLKKKDVNNNLSNFMSVFPTVGRVVECRKKLSKCFRGNFAPIYTNISLVHLFSISKAQCAYKEKTGGLYWKKFPPPGSRRAATLLVHCNMAYTCQSLSADINCFP